MVKSPGADLLLSLLPTLALSGDAKILEKIQYCAQFAPEKGKIDSMRLAQTQLEAQLDSLKAQLESIKNEKATKEQNEEIAELRRQLMEREILLNDFIQNHRLAEDLRKLEETNNSSGETQNYVRKIEQLEAQFEGINTKLQGAKKRNKEAKQKIKKAEEKMRQMEKSYDTSSKECKALHEKIIKMEQNEKQLQAQLHQSKLIQLQQQKKLQQLCNATSSLEDARDNKVPSASIGFGAKIKDSNETSRSSWRETHMVCPICMEQTKNVSLDGCGHTLCKGCAGIILSTPAKKCPICRKSVKAANPFYL